MRGNRYPTKSRPDRKMDAAIVLIMAVGRTMVEDEQVGGFPERPALRIMRMR